MFSRQERKEKILFKVEKINLLEDSLIKTKLHSNQFPQAEIKTLFLLWTTMQSSLSLVSIVRVFLA